MRPMAKRSAKNLTRDEWLRRSLEVLAAQGPGKLNIESLSRSLGVSRGSFYWHFENRDDFVNALLDLWFHEYTEVVPEMVDLGGGTGRERFARLIRAVQARDLTRFDLPIRSWAMQEPRVAQKVIETDNFRLEYIMQLFVMPS